MKEILENAFKPYDVVTNENGDVGFIQEVNINTCQPSCDISYAVNWIVGNETKHAWFDHGELIKHTNLFIEIAKASCNSHGRNDHNVESLFDNWSKK